MGKSDAEILDGSPFVVTFNDVDYEWRQHPRKVQRKIRAKLMGATAILAEMEHVSDAKRGVMAVDFINELLEICEDYCLEMAADIDSIEEHIRLSGSDSVTMVLTDIYQPLFENWLNPWLDDGTKKKPKAKKKST